MRNLKKVLSLALALVMLLGLMMVGAGAADTGFKDDASISADYKAAAAVNKALGLMTGDGSNLNPTAKIVRAEAFILSLRVDGSNTNEIASKWPVTEKPFNDVSTAKWYARYLAYGKEMGLIAGSNGNYNPEVNVTVVEYSILLLKQLGFDSARYVNNTNWDKNAVSDALAAGLYEGLGSINYYHHELTRQEACQMAFNALFYSPSDSNGYVIEGSDLVYPTMMEAVLAKLAMGTKGEDLEIKAAPASDTLAVKVYKLAPSTAIDDFGRTVSAWTVDGEEVYASSEAASAPAKTFTKLVSASDMAKELKNYTVNAETVLVNNEPQPAITAPADVAKLTGNGKLVELYATSKVIDKIIVVEYSVDTLKSVTEKDGITTYEFKTAKKVTNSEQATNAVFEGAVEEGDVVTIAKVGNVHHIYPTTSFEGNQTARKEGSVNNGKAVTTYTITVGGKYVIAEGVKGVAGNSFGNSANETTYFVDQYGFVVAKEASSAPATQYAVILQSVGAKSNATLDDPTGYTVNVRAALADGTIADYALALKKNDGGDLLSGDVTLAEKNDVDKITNDDKNPLNGDTGSLKEGTLIGYTLNDKDQMVLKAVGKGMIVGNTTMAANETYGSTLAGYKGDTSATDSVKSTINVLFTNQTVFVMYNGEGTKWTSGGSFTGLDDLKLPKDGLPGKAVIKAADGTTGVASVVFLKGPAAAEIVDYVYVDHTDVTLALKDKTSVWQYTGVTADGVKVDVTTGDGSDASTKLVASGLYPYDENNVLGDIMDTEDNVEEIASIEKIGDLLKIGKNYISMDGADEVYIASGVSEVANGQKALAVLNSDKSKVVAVFVLAKGEMNVTGIDEKTITVEAGKAADAITVVSDQTATVAARSANNAVARVSVDDKKVTITGVAEGETIVTITVTPENTQGYASVTEEIKVIVTKADSGSSTPDPKPEQHEHNYSWTAASADDVTAAGKLGVTVTEGQHVQKCGGSGDCDALYKGTAHNANMTYKAGEGDKDGKHVYTCDETDCTVADGTKEHNANMTYKAGEGDKDGKHVYTCDETNCTVADGTKEHNANMTYKAGEGDKDGKHVYTCDETNCTVADGTKEHNANMTYKAGEGDKDGKHVYTCDETDCTVADDTKEHNAEFEECTGVDDGGQKVDHSTAPATLDCKKASEGCDITSECKVDHTAV